MNISKIQGLEVQRTKEVRSHAVSGVDGTRRSYLASTNLVPIDSASTVTAINHSQTIENKNKLDIH